MQAIRLKRWLKKGIKKIATKIKRLCSQQRSLFDKEDSLGWPLFEEAFTSNLEHVQNVTFNQVVSGGTLILTPKMTGDVEDGVRHIAKEFAKLDGYDVVLRTLESKNQGDPLSESKCWSASVRVYANNDEWQSDDGTLKGSRDEAGQVRPEYAATVSLYDEKGNLVEGLLDPDCIEGRGWNLSAGQYKPFVFVTTKSEKSIVEIIGDLRKKEQKILEGLDTLLAMVEGKK